MPKPHHTADTTKRIADYVAAMRTGDMPEPVRREALRSFVNIVGCAVGGCRHDSVVLLDDTLAEFSGPAQATIIGRGHRRDALQAAMVNCLGSSVYAFDDTHAQAVVHPSGPVAAALLALCERQRIAGPDFLLAFMLGVETMCRLSKAMSVSPAQGSMGWSQTGITAGIAAAVAAGKVLNLDSNRLRHAIGIAASQAAGIRAALGTMSASLMTAQGAQTGLRAAILAQKGFQSSAISLEGPHGYLDAFSETPNVSALGDDLGSRYEILSNTYKPYPCGIVIHPVIEACLDLRERHGLHHADIAAVTVRVSSQAVALTDRRYPQDGLSARVSLYHWVAIAFIRGTASVQDMDTASAVLEPTVVRFQDKIETAANDATPNDAAEVMVTLNDGRSYTSRVEHCIGSATRPMTDDDLRQKFTGLAEHIIGPARTREAMQMCWDVERLADVGVIPQAASASLPAG